MNAASSMSPPAGGEKRLTLKDGVLVGSTGAHSKGKPTIQFIDNNCERSNGEWVISPGQGIKHGGRIYSRSREYYVTLEEDGNVVLYKVLNNARLVDGGVDTDRVAIWSSGIPEPPTEFLTNNKTTYDNYHGPYSLVMQHDGNLVLRYSREHCLLPAYVTTTADDDDGDGGGKKSTASPVARMMKTDTGFAYWVEDETDVILFPKIEEYSLAISNTGNNPGAKLVVTDWGQIVVDGGQGLSNKVLWRRG